MFFAAIFTLSYFNVERLNWLGITYLMIQKLAIFKQLRKTKFNKLLLLAEDENISVGDLIFEKMIECQSSENDFFNEMCS